MQLRPVMAATSAIGLAIAIAACSPAATPAPTVAPTTAPSAAATTAAGSPVGSSAASAAAKVKVNANTASQAEIAAALQANGVVNPANWAKEVVEYRPYPTDDATLKKLQDNLAKYRPDAATLAGILATLVP